MARFVLSTFRVALKVQEYKLHGWPHPTDDASVFVPSVSPERLQSTFNFANGLLPRAGQHLSLVSFSYSRGHRPVRRPLIAQMQTVCVGSVSVYT